MTKGKISISALGVKWLMGTLSKHHEVNESSEENA